VADYLSRKSHFLSISLELFELDILRKGSPDLSRESAQSPILDKIRAGFFDVVLASPPCSTFSRATWSNLRGPRPVRSFAFPRGFTWLRWRAKRQADLGNILADFALEAIHAQLQHPAGLALLEQPEDLGTVRSGPWPGARPASVWQFPKVQDILKLDAVHYGAFHQSSFGTPYPKPTRILFRLSGKLNPHIHLGPPQFTSDGSYMGPLPRPSCSSTLIRRESDKSFRTSGTAQWPPSFCEWVADEILLVFKDIAKGGIPSSPSSTPQIHQEEMVAPDFESSIIYNISCCKEGRRGGFGEPRVTSSSGKVSSFHDGFGLNSPGRWDPNRRDLPDDTSWQSLRTSLWSLLSENKGGPLNIQRLCFSMTKKAEDPLGEDLIHKCRRVIAEWCSSQGSPWSPSELLDVASGQPFPLKLIHEILRLAQDADYEFLRQAEIGLPVGVLNPLPRTPAVYEEQTSWRLQDDPLASVSCWASNYGSALEFQSHIREHFAEEVAEGLMEQVDRESATSRFGKHLSVAALAVLVDEVTDKKRIIHDGSNKVRVNHRIKSLDKIRMPGPKEKFALLKSLEDHRDIAIAVLGDVSKAHRRFKHCVEELGYLACQISEDDPFIFINKVGTFGISSAAYWWGRIFGAAGRATYYLLGPHWIVEMLAYADDLEVLGIGCQGREAIVLSYLFLSALGVPFKWQKMRGGLQVDWVGLHSDYILYKLGLSVSRAAWLSDWCLKVAEAGLVDPRLFTSGLGRLCFASGTLHWERPFLGPLYAWQASIRDMRCPVRVPWAISFILKWLSSKLASDLRLQSAPRITQSSIELFRTDARATEEGAWIGGWETVHGTDTSKCRWFALQVQESWAPWIFCRQRNPKRVIAALELLATLVAVMVFQDSLPRSSMGWCCCSGATDNKGNSFSVSKLMSTKFPTTLLLMELSEQLRSRSLELHLNWIPRGQNEPADDLSNMCFTRFSPDRRIELVGEDLKFLVLPHLTRVSQDLFDKIKHVREKRKEAGFLPHPESSRSKKPKLDSW